MKKVFVFTLICLALLLLVPGVVSAADDPLIDSTTASQSGTTNVTFGFAALYQLTVPPDFVLSTRQVVFEEVTISNALLDPRTKVVVNISSENYNDSALANEAAWRMKYVGNDGNSDIEIYLPYHLHKADSNLQGEPTYVDDPSTKVISRVELFSVCAEDLAYSGKSAVQFLAFKLDSADIAYSGQYKDTISFTAEIKECNEPHQ